MFVHKKILSSLVLAFTLLFFYLYGLGNRPFATPDEGRYVEIPREMVHSKDWLTPRLNGIKYFEKPPLFYWMQATAIKFLGTNEFFMRLWTVFFALFGCLATYHFARRFYSHEVGLFSAFVLGTSVLYFSLGRLIILDMPVSILSTLSLFSFFHGFHETRPIYRRLWFYAFSVFCALGVLTKGIMTLAIAGPIIVAWLTIMGNWGALRPLYLPSSLFLFLIVAAPWHIWVSLENPEFPHKYFIVEHVLRYTTNIHLRTKPFYFFVPVLFLGALPWIFFLPQALKQTYKKKPVDSFLTIWMLWVFVFFSLSNSKLVPYILPMFPPLSLCLGAYLFSYYEGHAKEKISITSFRVFGLISPIIYAFITQYTDTFVGKESVHPYAIALVIIFSLTAFISFFIHSAKKHVLALAVASVSVVFVLIKAAPHVQRPSIKEFAQYINQHKKPDHTVVSFMAYYQDLPVYTQGIVTVIEAKGELEFGTEVENVTNWMIPVHMFQTMWEKPNSTLWIVGRKTEIEAYQKNHPAFTPTLIAENHGNVLMKMGTDLP
jgi:4-amino-4-deoxy-L-arabinose transferase-like glycosyltransferase